MQVANNEQNARNRRRLYLYVDGFNLYHRKLKGSPELKWLCLKSLITKYVFPNDHVEKVSYFTAEVDPKKNLSTKRDRQRRYCSALRVTGADIHYGRFEERMRECKADGCNLRAKYPDMTEKMSDVNMAINIIRDYIEHGPDIIVALTADTDVIPALKMVRAEAKRLNRKPPNLVVLLPTEDRNQYYSRVENFGGVARIIQVKAEWIAGAQMPSEVGQFNRPNEWIVADA